jgi:secondary thiamine-phosphate synthase enzyme
VPAIAESTRIPVMQHVTIAVTTSEAIEFVDLTGALSGVVAGLDVDEGVATVLTRHTTTGLLINEHEPLLLADLRATFERLVPASLPYGHDDFGRRTVNLGPGERRNGPAHCRAALLRASETVPIAGGALALGRWQRLFLVEFDGGQRREVGVTIAGSRRRR